jgi:16S rRNA (guanine527-N7)-methyltransferase
MPVLDVGSGAGLPGILLSIAGFDVDLAERDNNKAAFLKNCKAHLGLSCRILCEDVYTINHSYDQITSRAFAPLKDLLSIQQNVSRETCGYYLKGESYQGEVESARILFGFDLSIITSVSSLASRVVIVSNVSRET